MLPRLDITGGLAKIAQPCDALARFRAGASKAKQRGPEGPILPERSLQLLPWGWGPAALIDERALSLED